MFSYLDVKIFKNKHKIAANQKIFNLFRIIYKYKKSKSKGISKELVSVISLVKQKDFTPANK